MAIIYLYPDELVLDSSAWTLTGAPDKMDAVDDPQGAPDDDTSYLECSTTPGSSEEITFGFDAMVEAVSIVSVTVHFRSKFASGSGTQRTEVNGVDQLGHPLIGSYVDFSDVLTTDPATGAAWSLAGLNGIAIKVEQLNTTMTARLTQIYLEVDFVPSAAKIGAAREIGSRLLRLFRRPVQTVRLEGPLPWADMELMSDAALIHAQYPGPDEGAGAGYKDWQRAPVRLYSTALDLDTLQVTVEAFDLRHYLCSFWDTAIATVPAGATSPGAARLDPGVTRSFLRASKAWVQNAAVAAQGSTQIIEIGTDVEKNEPLGLLVEEARTNDLLRSAFGAGVSTGWTVTGNVVDDTTDLLFHEDVSAQSAHFARAGSANCRLSQTADYNGGEVLTLSAWHKDEDAQALTWTLQRSTDSNYWNDTTETWGGAATQNAFPVRSSPLMDQSNPIVLSGAAQTLTLTFYAEGAANQDNHLYHAQLEQGRYATSAIVTEISAVIREADRLQIENLGENGRCWPTSCGTAGITYIPQASTDVGLLDAVLLDVTKFEAEAGFTWDRVLYRHSTGEFVFNRQTEGGSFEATLSATITRGTAVRIVARWTSEEEEHGLAANTISIFVDGVKGTDDIADDAATPGDWLRIGWKQDFAGPVDFAAGNLQHCTVSPFVLADEEIPDWL